MHDMRVMYDPVFGGHGAGGDDAVANAGTPKPPEVPAADKEAAVVALKSVFDPEIPVNIYDLGLIYDVSVDDAGAATVVMTLTTPACPVAASMPQEVADTVAAVEGIGEVEVQLIWEPAWTPERMSDEARLALGMF